MHRLVVDLHRRAVGVKQLPVRWWITFTERISFWPLLRWVP